MPSTTNNVVETNKEATPAITGESSCTETTTKRKRVKITFDIESDCHSDNKKESHKRNRVYYNEPLSKACKRVRKNLNPPTFCNKISIMQQELYNHINSQRYYMCDIKVHVTSPSQILIRDYNMGKMKFLIGKRGQTINRICGEYNVSVKFPSMEYIQQKYGNELKLISINGNYCMSLVGAVKEILDIVGTH